MKNILLFGCIVFMAIALTLTFGCGVQQNSGRDDHDNRTQTDHATHAGETPESSDVHQDEEAVAHDEEEAEIEVASEFMEMAEITLAKVNVGRIKASIDLSGEIGFNEDHLVHITPRFPGIIKEVNVKVGEFVNEGLVVATIEGNESMTHYTLKAPISGRIIEKHAAPGEHVSGEESIFLLADLSSVWVNLFVYPKDAAKIKSGQKAKISVLGSDDSAEGVIQYVTPVMDPQTRRITARVVLPNADNIWRPGSFVNAHIEVGEGEEGLMIEKNAVQILENKPVVFVQHEPNRFKPVEIIIGDSDSRNTLILSGLEVGAEYVNNGAFELKAKIVTNSLGGHAGHGH